MPITINNRRYLGNKYKLLTFIKDIVDKNCTNVTTIFDAFAGTGAVSSAFVDKTIISNDLLYSNHICHHAWFSPAKFSKTKIKNLIDKYNDQETPTDENYMSINFSGTFFSRFVCRKIGVIRQDIEDKFLAKQINKKERSILIASLLYAMDRIAATCGHYDAFRKNGVNENEDLLLEPLNFYLGLSSNNKCFNDDANKLVKKVQCDILYLDPPYNSRQYCDAYHLLENVARWEKPDVFGVAKKMDRASLKSDYCKKSATQAFEDLINSANARYILLSYNNTGEAATDRSNAKMSDEDIIRILKKKGTVKVFSKKYKAFTTGKSENEDNEERVFLCVCNQTAELPNIASLMNYTGGKFRLLSQIKPKFPHEIDTFIDLFCGGCNVGLNVKAESHIYNDSNKLVVHLYQTINKMGSTEFLKRAEDVIAKYSLSVSDENGYEHYQSNSSNGLADYNRKQYKKLKSDFNLLTEKDEDYFVMFFVLIVFSFNNNIRFNRSGEFNLPAGKRDLNGSIKNKLVGFCERLKSQTATFTSSSFEAINLNGLTKKSLVYVDPPYLISTATYNEQNQWTEADEKRLLDFLDKLHHKGIRFALSNVLTHKGETNNLLKSWLERHAGEYFCENLDMNYSNSSYNATNKDQRFKTNEVLITNYCI